MNCPYCNKEHPDGVQYCSECGRSLTNLQICRNPDCRKTGLPSAAVYCPDCGWKIRAADSNNLDPQGRSRPIGDQSVYNRDLNLLRDLENLIKQKN